MPQLDFTLWMVKCTTKWTIMLLVLLMLNSSALLSSKVITTKLIKKTNQKENQKWPW